MSTVTDAVREQLMATSIEYQRLREEHTRHAARLEELLSKRYLTEQEKIEEIRLKKLKLHLKDEMEMLVQRARAR